MLKLYGFSTQNTLKTLYLLEELSYDYEFVFTDLLKAENRSDVFLKMNPIGKTPVLQIDDNYIFESGAICRYVANVRQSALYPAETLARAKVDQWMDFFSCHLGRWLSTLYYEHVIKSRASIGNPDPDTCAEANKFASKQLSIINTVLSKHPFLCGDELTIADFFAFAYIEQADAVKFELNDFPKVKTWLEKIASRSSVQAAKQRLPK